MCITEKTLVANLFLAPSLVPAEADRRVLPQEWYRHSGVLTTRTRTAP